MPDRKPRNGKVKLTHPKLNKTITVKAHQVATYKTSGWQPTADKTARPEQKGA